MRLLLDECVDQRLRLFFAGHECHTAAYAGFTGLKNGLLLDAAEGGGFEVVITTDREIPFQQNLEQRRIAILILCAPTNRLADLKSSTSAAIVLVQCEMESGRSPLVSIARALGSRGRRLQLVSKRNQVDSCPRIAPLTPQKQNWLGKEAITTRFRRLRRRAGSFGNR